MPEEILAKVIIISYGLTVPAQYLRVIAHWFTRKACPSEGGGIQHVCMQRHLTVFIDLLWLNIFFIFKNEKD